MWSYVGNTGDIVNNMWNIGKIYVYNNNFQTVTNIMNPERKQQLPKKLPVNMEDRVTNLLMEKIEFNPADWHKEALKTLLPF